MLLCYYYPVVEVKLVAVPAVGPNTGNSASQVGLLSFHPDDLVDERYQMKQTQRTFQFSSDMLTYSMALLSLMGFAYLLFVSVPVFDFFSLLTANKNDYLVLAILAPGLMPFALLGFYLFYRHSGYVIMCQS